MFVLTCACQDDEAEESHSFATSSWTQFCVLVYRTFLCIIRDAVSDVTLLWTFLELHYCQYPFDLSRVPEASAATDRYIQLYTISDVPQHMKHRPMIDCHLIAALQTLGNQDICVRSYS